MEVKTPLISVIIRTKNEEKYLKRVLDMITKQSFRDFEILIIDNNSTDDTKEIARRYDCRIVEIPEGKFSHPYSCNLGAKEARGKYLVYLNGHTIPEYEDFFESGLSEFIRDKNIAGVYASALAHKDGTFADKLLYNIGGYTIGRFRFEANIQRTTGLLGTTNAMIRKDLWEKYPFSENLNNGFGGEDVDWALHFMKKGYSIIHNPRLTVRHSHHLRLRDIAWQNKNWGQMKKDGKPERQRKNF